MALHVYPAERGQALVGDVPTIVSGQVRRPGPVERAVSRTLDVVGSLALLLVLSPLLLVIAIVVRVTSPGPALFIQERVGRDESRFRVVKFRTMYADCSTDPHQRYVRDLLTGKVPVDAKLYKLVDDPRVTRFGRFLRRTSLDELPQLFNVLMGQMALVGPRPVIAYEAELLDDDQRLRFGTRPGMTGLWQVSGRNTLTFLDQLVLDVRYVTERSLWLDLRILLRTIPAVLSRETR